MKQKALRWFFCLSNGISTSTICVCVWRDIEALDWICGTAFGGRGAAAHTYRSELAEEDFDLFVADLGRQAADENFAVARLGLLWIDFFVIDHVFPGGCHLLDGIGRCVYDECKAS